MERIVLVQAWALFLLIELALRVLPFKRVRTLCDNAGRKGPEKSSEAVPSVSRLAWLVEVAGRFTPVTATCLKQALVLSWLLGRRGIAATLHIGVARNAETLAAHAWLENNGQVIFGRSEQDGFTTLVSATMIRQVAP
jgi:hypothetical protein